MLEHTLADSLLELFGGQFAGFEELLNQSLIGFSDGLHQRGAPFGGLIGHFGRDLGFFDVGAEVVLVDVSLVADQVDDAAQVAFGSDGELDGHGIGLEPILDLPVNLEEIRAGAVHLVDEHHPRNGVAISLTPDGFGLGLDTTHGAEHCNHSIKHPHGTLHLDGEVHVPGCINDVDPVVLPRRGNGSRGDGDATFPFLGHPVGHGGAVVHLTDLVHHA